MNTEPAQHVPAHIGSRSEQLACLCHDTIDCPEQATIAIGVTALARAADLLDLLDGFLRSGNVADNLRDYLDTTKTDHPNRAGYDTNLVIDLVGLTAHNLRQATVVAVTE